MLQALNSAGSSGRDAVRAHYDLASLLLPDFYANYSFEQWLHFMVNQTLLLDDGNVVTITLAGREFLTFIVQEGKAFQKTG